MKKKIILFAIGLISIGSLKAQDVEQFFYGARFGIGQSEFANVDLKNGDFQSQTGKLALNGGISAGYYFIENLGIGLDALVVSKGSKLAGESNSGGINPQKYKFEETFNIINVEIPFMLKARIGKDNFHVVGMGGITQNFNLIGVSSRTYENSNYNSNNGYIGQNIAGIKVSENSILFGIGLEIANSNDQIFYVDFRKSRGITNFSTNTALGFNDYYAISIGYSY